jgi:hypothetical protein
VDNDPVFASQCYTELHAANVRRAFLGVAVDADPQAAVAGACSTSSTSQPIASSSRASRLDHSRDRRPEIPGEFQQRMRRFTVISFGPSRHSRAAACAVLNL